MTLCFFIIALTIVPEHRLCASRREEGQTTNRGIALTELEFHDVQIRAACHDRYEFVGRIRNKSKEYSLQSVAVRILYYDCTDRLDAGTCEVIGERHETIYLTIPPGQETAFKEPIYVFGDLLKVRGEFVWRYEVLSIKAGR